MSIVVRSGRKKDLIWSLFLEETRNDISKTKRVKCKYCLHTLVAQVARMRSHTMGCRKAPEETKRDVRARLNRTSRSGNDAGTLISDSTSSISSLCSMPTSFTASSARKNLQPKLEAFVDAFVGQQLQHELDETLLTALITGNVPLSFLENEHFRMFLSKLQPSFQQLSRSRAVRFILPALSARTMAQVERFISMENHLTLLSDGWDSVASQHYVNWVVGGSSGSTALYKVESAAVMETAEMIVNRVKEIASELRKIHNSDKPLVCHFVSDSSGPYRKARRILSMEGVKSGITLTGSCLAHQTNLMLKDLMKAPSLNQKMASVIEIASFIRSSIAFRAAMCTYLQRQSIAMWIPTETRWYSFVTTVKQVLDLKQCIQIVAKEQQNETYMRKKRAQDFVQVVQASSFWQDTANLYVLLKPYAIATGITELEYVTAGMILITWSWLHILLPKCALLTAEELEIIRGKIKRRTKNFVEDHHMMAWILDHRLQGAGLTSAASQKLREAACEIAPKLIPELNLRAFGKQWIQYQNKDGVFSQRMLWDNYDPMIFWLDVQEDAPELAKFARTVLSVRPHVAGCEHIWSMSAAIITKARNRLQEHRFAHMIQIKHHKRNQDETRLKKTREKAKKKIEELLDLVSIEVTAQKGCMTRSVVRSGEARVIKEETLMETIVEDDGALLEEADLDLDKDFNDVEDKMEHECCSVEKGTEYMERMKIIIDALDENDLGSDGGEAPLQTHGFEMQHKYIDERTYQNFSDIFSFIFN